MPFFRHRQSFNRYKITYKMIKQQLVRVCTANYFTTFLVFGILGLSAPIMAQVTLSLTLNEKNGVTTVLSGEKYTYQLNYAVSSTTGSANNVKIVVDLPDGNDIYQLEDLVGTTHAPTGNFVYTAGPDKKLTITFVTPLSSGSTGVLEFSVRTANLLTPNGTVQTTTAELTDGGGFSSGIKTGAVTVNAVPNFCVQKTLLSGGAIGYPTTYRVFLKSGNTIYQEVPKGTLQPTNISFTDYLPTGAQFISANIYKWGTTNPVGTGTYNSGAQTITATIPDIQIFQFSNPYWTAENYWMDITVIYDSPTFSVGNTITNTTTATFTPLGGSQMTVTDGVAIGNCTSDLNEVHTLAAPSITTTFTKTAAGTTIFPGNYFYYSLNFANTGNVPLDNFEIIDTFPSDLRLDYSVETKGIRSDNWSTFIDHAEYQTNNNPSWTALAASATNNIPIVPLPDYMTKIKFVFKSPFPASTTWTGYNIIYFKPATEVTVETPITNCIAWNSTTAGIPTNRTTCNNDITLMPRPTTARILYDITHDRGATCATTIGQNVRYSGTLKADAGYGDATDPKIVFFIPHGIDYVPNSLIFTQLTSGITVTPTLDITPNYTTQTGITYDMYRFTFPSGTILPYGTSFKVSVNTVLTNALAPNSYPAGSIATAANASLSVSNGGVLFTLTDTQDWDNDANTTETFTTASTSWSVCSILVNAAASMESIKWVKGLCDTVYSRFPAFGQTVPGGNADYRLVVKNTGNVPMKDVKIIDIMPFVGDVGVIDPSARSTAWRPNLADPISAPSGITVYYTTVSNPCRDEVKQPTDASPFPTGCSTANWSATPPSDITKVQAVKIDFGTTVLTGGDSLLFSWPMRAPVNAPTNNEIAWNSFAFVATRTDNNQPLLAAEPIKVGIKVKEPAPAFYGNRVWFDTDHDGIQDAGEGGVDGIKVKLFSPKNSGVQDPVTDSLINFTITGNGGFYIFSNLLPGDYYAVFCLPNGYTVSPKNAGGTADTDSDGATISYNGGTATMAPITNLTSLEIDETWDQGIYCSFSPTVSPIQIVANGNSATLTATGGTTYTWTGPNGFNATTASITINNVTPADTGTYTVNVSDGSCYASLNTKIEICTPPTAPSVSSPIMNSCPLITMNLTAISSALVPSVSGGVFEWHVSNSPNSALVSNPTDVGAGDYYLFERSPTDCYSTGSKVTVNIQTCCPTKVCIPVTITRN